jgi:hypothetical protein
MPKYPAAAAAQTMKRLGWCIDRRDWDGVSAILAGEVTWTTPTVRRRPGDLDRSRGRRAMARNARRARSDAAPHHRRRGRSTGSHLRAHHRDVVATHVGGPDVGGQLWTIGGWYEATLDDGLEGQILSALTLHPLWETGTREILGLR